MKCENEKRNGKSLRMIWLTDGINLLRDTGWQLRLVPPKRFNTKKAIAFDTLAFSVRLTYTWYELVIREVMG